MLLIIFYLLTSIHALLQFDYVKPSYTIIEPISSNAVGQTCTNSSKHKVCTCKCELNAFYARCIPQSEPSFCNLKFERICPTGCKYDIMKAQCIPTLPTNICEPDWSIFPPLCPIGCVFLMVFVKVLDVIIY